MMVPYNLKEAEKQRIQLGAFLVRDMDESSPATKEQVTAWFVAVSRLVAGFGEAHQRIAELEKLWYRCEPR